MKVSYRIKISLRVLLYGDDDNGDDSNGDDRDIRDVCGGDDSGIGCVDGDDVVVVAVLVVTSNDYGVVVVSGDRGDVCDDCDDVDGDSNKCGISGSNFSGVSSGYDGGDGNVSDNGSNSDGGDGGGGNQLW